LTLLSNLLVRVGLLADFRRPFSARAEKIDVSA
jgi:hypothetical protein